MMRILLVTHSVFVAKSDDVERLFTAKVWNVSRKNAWFQYYSVHAEGIPHFAFNG